VALLSSTASARGKVDVQIALPIVRIRSQDIQSRSGEEKIESEEILGVA
jgi:hypothetical protein